MHFQINICRNVVVVGESVLGRKIWRKYVNDGMKMFGFQPEWAVFRDIWRDFISGANV